MLYEGFKNIEPTKRHPFGTLAPPPKASKPRHRGVAGDCHCRWFHAAGLLLFGTSMSKTFPATLAEGSGGRYGKVVGLCWFCHFLGDFCMPSALPKGFGTSYHLFVIWF